MNKDLLEKYILTLSKEEKDYTNEDYQTKYMVENDSNLNEFVRSIKRAVEWRAYGDLSGAGLTRSGCGRKSRPDPRGQRDEADGAYGTDGRRGGLNLCESLNFY